MSSNAPSAFVDYYEILAISPDSSDKSIMRAYRKCARVMHPDKNPENEKESCTEKFLLITSALEVLLNPIKKSEFDKRRNAIIEERRKRYNLDKKRAKMINELDRREQEAKPKSYNKTESSIFRHQGASVIQQEAERLRNEMNQRKTSTVIASIRKSTTIMSIINFYRQYGPILSAKRVEDTVVIVFENRCDAERARNKCSFLPSSFEHANSFPEHPQHCQKHYMDIDSLEDEVLAKMRKLTKSKL
ncbi:hypothetical protein GJ496_004218 [Pomphorhynchus laevis]|nr:hypothetical protein GJ496_004218 [Pomphorhynchus laevis]